MMKTISEPLKFIITTNKSNHSLSFYLIYIYMPYDEILHIVWFTLSLAINSASVTRNDILMPIHVSLAH